MQVEYRNIAPAELNIRLFSHFKWRQVGGGALFGAFAAGELKGSASVEAVPLGSLGQYLDLSCLHVSEELMHRG